MCGSPGYVAPEILKNHEATTKSDIFGIGVIFYNMLTGRALFIGKSQLEVLEQNKDVDISYATKYINRLPTQARSLLL